MMGKVKKIGDEYYIEFLARGLKYQQKAGADYAAAQKLLEDTEAKIAQGEMGIIVRDVESEIFFKDFLENAKVQHSVQSFSRYQQTASHFTNFIQKKLPETKKLSGLTPAVFESYKEYLGKESLGTGRAVSSEVINFTLILLRDIMEYARKIGYLNDNPLLHIPFVKTKSLLRPPFLQLDEYNKILNMSSGKLRNGIQCIYLTGLQLDELVALRWSDVDWDEPCLWVPDHGCEAAKEKKRRIPLGPAMQELLQGESRSSDEDFIFKDKDGQALDKADLVKQLDELNARLNDLAPISFSVFRNTFARNLILKNSSLVSLAQMLGLNDVAKVMFYFGYLLDNKDDVLTTSPYSI